MTNLIDVLINAKWLGGGATSEAGDDLRDLGDDAAKTAVEMAALKQRSAGLNRVLAHLGEEVSSGSLTLEEATEQYQEFTATLTDMKIAAPKAGAGLGQLIPIAGAVTAALAVSAVAAKKLYAAVEEGANLDLVQRRFERTAASIGLTGETLSSDFRYVTQSMISDSEAMALSTDLMAQGLATTHDEVVRLTGVTTELEINIAQLINALTEKTTTQFDIMGISVDGFEEKVAKLEAAGIDADEAFRWAFIEQAEEQIERIGSRAETAAGQLDILNATWANTKDEVKLAVLEGFRPLIEDISGGILAMAALDKATRDARLAIGDLAGQKAAVNDFAAALEILRGDDDDPKTFRAQSEALRDFAATLIITGQTVEEQQQILRDFGFTFEDTVLGQRVVLEGYETSWDTVTDAVVAFRLEAQASYDTWRRLGDYSIDFDKVRRWKILPRRSRLSILIS
jgi:hypothetical protein